jgi:ferric-dicitrate binding protein FerR (iron transport regulator)
VKPARLEELLARWDDGALTAAEHAELERLLEDPDARRALVAHDLLAVDLTQALRDEKPRASAAPARGRVAFASLAGAVALAAAVLLWARARERPVAPIPADPVASLLLLRGGASLEGPAGKRPVARGAALRAGDRVALSSDALAVLTHGAARVVLSGGAAVAMEPPADEGGPPALRLSSGRVQADYAGDGRRRLLVAGSPGTVHATDAAFSVLLSEARARVEVGRGRVVLDPAGAGEPRELAAGQGAVVGANGDVELTTAGAEGVARALAAERGTAMGPVAAAATASPAASELARLRRIPRETVERLAALRKRNLSQALAQTPRSACAGGQVGVATLFVEAAVLADSALLQAAWDGVLATFDRELAGGETRTRALCTAHWLGDLAHAALVLREAEPGLVEPARIESLTAFVRRAAASLEDPAPARELRSHRRTPGYTLVFAAGFLLASELLGDEALGREGAGWLARGLADQRTDGALPMGSPPRPDTAYQGLGLSRLGRLAARKTGERHQEAFASGARWLAARVRPDGDVDVTGNAKTQVCTPRGRACRHARHEDIAWTLLYLGTQADDDDALEAAARVVGSRALD